jgi:DNA polymerase V
MFCNGQAERSDELMSVIDGINKKFGKSTLFLAAEGMNKKWKMKQEQSPCYTTVWQDLPRVKC